ncbi:MAG: DAK2 domain-containing protein [Candidatus Kariarchaeaceae archaeon]|jgi:DAK2 domain fusion protein YloV
MAELTGPLLKKMITESYSRIDNKKAYLNDLNVFPVPDGDTGLNMSITMGKVVEELEKQEADQLTIKTAAKAIAKGAFVGAKGNSGVILSQFFVGFAKTIENEEKITTEIFADALVEGSKRAYKAVMNPKEGTILTVVKETAEAAKEKASTGASWKEIVQYCYEIAQKATAETPNLLEELKEAGVIDAGALGFVYLIQGWLVVISSDVDGPRVIQLQSGLEGLHNSVNVDSSVSELKFQYCTEALIHGVTTTEDDIRSKLADYGDSLIVIQEESAMKLHIHANEPKTAIQIFASHGYLKAAKIDDMKSQTLQSHE